MFTWSEYIPIFLKTMCDIIVIALESSRVSANAYEVGWSFEIAFGAIPPQNHCQN